MGRTVLQRELLLRFRSGFLLLVWEDGSQHWETPGGVLAATEVGDRTLDAMLAAGDLEVEELGRVHPETGHLHLTRAHRLSLGFSRKLKYETCEHCGRPMRAGSAYICTPCE